MAKRNKVDEYADRVKETLADAWLPEIYRQRVLAKRSRAYNFEGLTANAPEIQHTLLGVELKVGRRRMLCPDLATARYLAIFARVGCDSVAVPYDITKVSQLADELESSWHRAFLLADHYTAAESENFKSRLRRKLSANIKTEINEAGAGTAVPEFKQNTRQNLER
ncbi:MAG TPA: hypothetical protein VLL54_04115 [Pyrinomonadaceae bacterium]|nr:hypothetical protein [Pyrinomonadaceae bacterium]